MLLVRWSFRFWRKSAEQQKEIRLLQQETADQFYKKMVMREAWAVWVRRYRVEEWARWTFLFVILFFIFVLFVCLLLFLFFVNPIP